MYGLIDCNNFYASCERVFNPALRERAIIILSNNDGCVIARSNEAKAIGIKMGVPAFEIKQLIEKHNVAVFSSNFPLYGDMSARVMAQLSSFTPEAEIYSIDEAFLNLVGFSHLGWKEYGTTITKTVTKNTGIPVSLGIAPTKTLAKVANKFAKKYAGYKNVCVIDSEEKREKALKLTDIGDVWGVGRRYEKMLKQRGILTAWDFTQLHRSWVRKNLTVVGERMWCELGGESCIGMELIPPPKKQIMTSRSFSKMVESQETLIEAVANFASSCAEKLRSQQSCAAALMVFVHTNPFRDDLEQYYRNTIVKLPVASSSTLEIVHYAVEGLKQIYEPGFKYKKAGVMMMELTHENAVQTSLFDNVDRPKHARLMETLDRINANTASNKVVKLAVMGDRSEWKMRQENLSPCYTTKLSDIIKVR